MEPYASHTRLIFTVTTGRSGTALLHRLFRLLPNVASFHEPEPKFSHLLRMVQGAPQLAREFLQYTKLPVIAQCDRTIYVETSHLFCKGFLEPAQQLGLRFDLIVLRRAVREVARSLYELDTVPARTDWGQSFLLAPSRSRRVAAPRMGNPARLSTLLLVLSRNRTKGKTVFSARGRPGRSRCRNIARRSRGGRVSPGVTKPGVACTAPPRFRIANEESHFIAG